MNITSSLVLIIIFCLPLAGMSAMALMRVSDRRTKYLFTGLAFALILWAVPLVLVKADFLSAETIAMASRLTFSGGVLSVTLLYLFFEHFANFPRGFWRYLILVNGLLVFIAVVLGFVEEGVRPVAGGYAPNHGPLHKYFVISQSATVIFSFAMAGFAYRRSENALLRFQIRSIRGYGFIGFLFPIINNGIMPILVPGYAFPAFGVIGILLFQFGIFNMLVRGEWLFVRNLLGRLRHSMAWHRKENITSLSRLVDLLNSIVSGDTADFRESYPFITAAGAALKLHAQSDSPAGSYTTPARFNEQILPKWNQGIIDNLIRLEADNKRLAFYLHKAESLVNDRWLSSVVKSIGRVQTLELPALPLNLYAAEHDGLVTQYRDIFGEELLVSSPAMFQVVENLKRFKDTQLPVVIEGEPGVGKATLARSLHYLRTKSGIAVLECDFHTKYLFARLIRLAQRAAAENITGIIVRQVDSVQPDELNLLISYLMRAQDLPRLYLTIRSKEGFLAKLSDQAQRAWTDALPDVAVPSLASRPEDLRSQLFYFADKISRAGNFRFSHITKDLLDSALQYSWPGNTAELKVRLEQALLTQTAGTALDAKSLNLREIPRALEGESLSPLEKAERDVIWECLQRRKFNQRQTAIELAITINTLRAKMEKYSLHIPSQK